MKQMNLAKQLYDVARLEGTFVLRSGQISNEYFDKYRISADPKYLHAVSEALAGLIPDGIEVLAGLEMGAIPIVTALSLQTQLPAAIVRKKAKEYGTAKLSEGADILGKRVCVIEDVVTTGGQVVQSTLELRQAGAWIEDAICVIERNPEGRKRLDEIGVRLHSLYTMDDLIAASKSG